MIHKKVKKNTMSIQKFMKIPFILMEHVRSLIGVLAHFSAKVKATSNDLLSAAIAEVKELVEE